MTLAAAKLRGCLRLLDQFKSPPNSFTGPAGERGLAVAESNCSSAFDSVAMALPTNTAQRLPGWEEVRALQ